MSAATVTDFLQCPVDRILGRLAERSGFAIEASQRDAWVRQIEILQCALKGVSGTLFFEFSIPRIGRRIDVVLLVGPLVFVVEFKVGERRFDRSAMDQVWDYALDLKNFHEASHGVSIVPILIATEAADIAPIDLVADADEVYRPISVNVGRFRDVLDLALQKITGTGIDSQQWSCSPYHPTPTIVEAARALYAQHSVEAIARYDAGAQNLHVTSRRIEEMVDEARERDNARSFVLLPACRERGGRKSELVS
jgi:hypothetical protein